MTSGLLAATGARSGCPWVADSSTVADLMKLDLSVHSGELAAHPALRRFPAECAGDHGHVVIDHTEIGTLIGVIRTHGVGEEFAADDHLVVPGGGTLDERSDVTVGNRGLDEHGADLPGNQEVDKLRDPVEARFAFGRDPLDAEHV